MDNSEAGQIVSGTLHEIAVLRGVQSLMDWDERVYMPKLGGPGRGEQLSMVASLIHARQTAPKFLEALYALRDASEPGSDSAIVAREAIPHAERAQKVPASLVSAIASAESSTHGRWLEARAAEDFSVVHQELARLFELKLEYARCIQGPGGLYDALLDLYEPGLTVRQADALFAGVGQELRSLLGRIEERAYQAPRFAPDAFPKALQFQFCKDVSALLGFSYEEGRFDETVHPFCTDIGPADIRITTKFAEGDLRTALYGTIHETGHALYDQGLPKEHYYNPLGEARSLGIHESQSLIWEKFVGRSKEFCGFLFSLAQGRFSSALQGLSEQEFYRYVNEVRRGFIRIEADEVSYGLHILVRFELEKALVSGGLKVSDLKSAWNEKYREYLALDPTSDRVGVLQDIHWYSGSFGYFPTYLFGAIAAAQLGTALRKAHPEYFAGLREGAAASILAWLRANIHAHGKRYSAAELIRRATGAGLSSASYLQYLKSKFAEVYEL